MLFKKLVLFSIFTLLCLCVNAQQEMLFPLGYNPVIKTYLDTHQQPAAKITSTGDTLQLPFIDDFSYDGIYPNDTLWTDNNVFINRDFPVDPPTLGVATFDGLNNLGNPYEPNGTIDDVADHLTSNYINLNYPGDTTVWLSFFYQPQGLGERPDAKDSLSLEFINPANDTIWNTVWAVAGTSNKAFTQAMVRVDTTYLQSGFRFRFTNIANLNGNVDHWHLDYIRLDRGRSVNDTGFVNEGAFLYRTSSLLKAPYTSMPYSHYKTNRAQFTVTNQSTSYKNLSASPLNFSHEMRIVKENGTTDFTTGVGAINLNPYTTVQTNKILNSYILPDLPQPELRYAAWNINTIPDINPQNDTVKETQILSNYYAYDDGTAEAAYGLFGATSGSRLAFKFDLKMADTLGGVDIYWNQFGPDVHNRLINIAVWDQLAPNTNNDRLLYRLVDQKPQNTNNINGFYRYVFETPLPVSGTIYVGWIQYDVDLLNVGFDKNTDAHDYLYFNVLNSWQQSTLSGTVMIRPVFGGTLASVGEMNPADFTVNAFPNPATNLIKIAVNAKKSSAYSFQLMDAVGRIVLHQKETEMNVAQLASGFYLLKIMDTESQQSVTTKILVSH